MGTDRVGYDRARMIKNPLAEGTLVALGAAALFGVATPMIQHFGQGVGPFATAALLYAGAALGVGLPSRAGNEPALERKHLRRVVVVSLFGAAAPPPAAAAC